MISRHFSYQELTKTSVSEKNEPNSYQLENITKLAIFVLEPIRAKFDAVKINSCFRSGVVNRSVGGSFTSQHLANSGAAADIGSVENATLLEVYSWIKSNLNYDQLIIEGVRSFDKPENMKWLHVSFDSTNNRKENLIMCNGKYKKI